MLAQEMCQPAHASVGTAPNFVAAAYYQQAGIGTGVARCRHIKTARQTVRIERE